MDICSYYESTTAEIRHNPVGATLSVNPSETVGVEHRSLTEFALLGVLTVLLALVSMAAVL